MSVTETLPPLEQLFNPNSLEYAYGSGPQCLALASRGRLVWYGALAGLDNDPAARHSGLLDKSDPAHFTEPEKFDVSRSFDPDIVFGYGPRYCIGAALAKRQLYLSMTELFKRFPRAELAEEPLRDFSDHNAITSKQLLIKINCR